VCGKNSKRIAARLVTLLFDSSFTARWLPEEKRVFKQLFDGKNVPDPKLLQEMVKKFHQEPKK